jgi:hypothetical protein
MCRLWRKFEARFSFVGCVREEWRWWNVMLTWCILISQSQKYFCSNTSDHVWLRQWRNLQRVFVIQISVVWFFAGCGIGSPWTDEQNETSVTTVQVSYCSKRERINGHVKCSTSYVRSTYTTCILPSFFMKLRRLRKWTWLLSSHSTDGRSATTIFLSCVLFLIIVLSNRLLIMIFPEIVISCWSRSISTLTEASPPGRAARVTRPHPKECPAWTEALPRATQLAVFGVV